MLQTKQIKNIENVLVTTRDELVSNIVKNVNSSNIADASSTINDISKINDMINILGINIPVNKKNDKTNNEKSTVDSKKETKTSRNKKTFYLGDDLKSKRPIAVEINGEKKKVSSFKDMTRAICEEVFSLNPNAFKNLENIEDVNGTNQQYFSSVESKINEPTEITSKNGDNFFVDVTKLAMNNMLFLRKMLKNVGIEEQNIKIEIDPKYQRKPRSAKKVAEA